MTSEEKMREEFEGWQIEEGLTDPMWFEPGWFDEKNQEYRLDKVNSDWSIWKAAWKASRESLVIELPTGEQFEPMGISVRIGYDSAIADCQESIHASGVKTK